MALIIDGKQLALEIQTNLAAEAAKIKKAYGVPPGLAAVLLGENPASHVYVRNKRRACEEVGIASFPNDLPETTSQEELLQLIDQLNQDQNVHGILVQLPLPKHISEEKILNAITPVKDVDGFHPINAGKLLLGQPSFRPCTPSGIMQLLESVGCDLKGTRAAVIGRSNIVGKPIALMLLERHATVTICHSRTRDLEKRINEADIVVAAIGRPEFIKGSWIKKGAVVIDVGINRTDDGKLVGDVEFEEAKKRAKAITPVPGGVGPMTIAMLLKNVVEAARLQLEGET